MEQQGTSTVLTAAIVSGALVIGLFVGLSLGNLARDFSASSSGQDMALPQQK